MNISKTNSLIGIVEDVLGVNPTYKTRKVEYIQARAICYYIMRNEMNMTFQFIGSQFNMNHATVMASLCNFKNEVEVDASFRNNYRKILQVWKSESKEYIELDPILLKKTVNNLVKSNKLLSLELEELQSTVKNIKELIDV
jgi:hypothetical protein|tara:strand:- start:270 stop:692 length:423 start_codon:yes stop_codon:yes gene_type:complete